MQTCHTLATCLLQTRWITPAKPSPPEWLPAGGLLEVTARPPFRREPPAPRRRSGETAGSPRRCLRGSPPGNAALPRPGGFALSGGNAAGRPAAAGVGRAACAGREREGGPEPLACSEPCSPGHAEGAAGARGGTPAVRRPGKGAASPAAHAAPRGPLPPDGPGRPPLPGHCPPRPLSGRGAAPSARRQPRGRRHRSAARAPSAPLWAQGPCSGRAPHLAGWGGVTAAGLLGAPPLSPATGRTPHSGSAPALTPPRSQD